MAGNVWEWTNSLHRGYPYVADDGREDSGGGGRVLRGGAFNYIRYRVCCAYRGDDDPDSRIDLVGFRVVAPGSGALASGGMGLFATIRRRRCEFFEPYDRVWRVFPWAETYPAWLVVRLRDSAEPGDLVHKCRARGRWAGCRARDVS